MSRIFVVGIGPGGIEDMSFRAQKALEDSDYIIGYKTYIDLIKENFPHKQFISSSMTLEKERCYEVLNKALEGYSVSLISSGDSGIYGMAGIMLEIVNKANSDLQVEIIPGITAASAAAAILGAPLMNDFAVVSLSDYLTPWEVIYKRLESAAMGDFVTCLYNPKSKKRTEYIKIARDIFLKYRNPNTIVGIVRNGGRENESVEITNLNSMLGCPIDMFSLVVIGNSSTYVEKGKMITPRGYKIG